MTESSNDKYTSERFISEITKIHNLKENELYSTNEFNEKKVAIIIDVINKGISQNLDDFLTDILMLKEKGILNIDEIKQIKSSLSSKVENVTPALPKEINYYCENCKNEIELTPEEIRKGIFICPDCSAINSTSNLTEPKLDVTEPNGNIIICKHCNTAFDINFTITNQDGILCKHCGEMNPLGIDETNINIKEDNTSDTELNNSTNDIIICKHCNKVFDKNFTMTNQDGILCKHCGEMNLFSSDEQQREIRREYIKQENNKPSKKKRSVTAKVFITLGAIVFVLFIGLLIIVNEDIKESEKRKYELEQTQKKELKEQRERIESELKNKTPEEVQQEFQEWRKQEHERYEMEQRKKQEEEDAAKLRSNMKKAEREADKQELEYLKERYLKK